MFRHITWLGSLAMLALVGVIVGCTREPSAQPDVAQPSGPSAAGAEYLLAAAPEGARDVMAAREQAADQEEVVVIGRIGGSVEPWVDGRAAFSVVDRSLRACSDIPGDNCPTPWDYCCEADLPKGTALVKVVDGEGNLLATDARELLGLSELQTVVVKGTAQRDDAGNLTILADGIYAGEE